MKEEVTKLGNTVSLETPLVARITLDKENTLLIIRDLSGVESRLNQLRSEAYSDADIEHKILHTDLFFELVELSKVIEIDERLADLIGAESKQDAIDRFPDALSGEARLGFRHFFVCVLRDRDLVYEGRLRHLQTGEPIYFQFCIRMHRCGESFYSIAVLSEQIELRNEVERSESRVQMALEASQAGIWEVDVSSMTLRGDRTYYELLGHPVGSMDGPVSWIRSLLHPDDFEETVKLTSAVMAGELANLNRKVRYRTPSGRYRWYQLRFRATRLGVDGKPLNAIGTVTDVHEEVRTDRLLWLERNVLGMRGTLAELLEHFAVGIEREWDECRCLVIIFNNQSKMVSDCVAPTLGEFMRRRVHGLSIDELDEDIRSVITLKDSVCRPWTIPPDEDCPEFLKSICKYTISSPIIVGKEVQGVVCTLHSKQPSEAEAALVQRLVQTMQFLFERQFHADKEAEFEAKVLTEDHLDSLGKLAGGIAHDFNNLLTIMLSHTELISSYSNNSDIRDSTEQITEAAFMATNLCRKMLTYAGESSFELCDFCMTEITESVIDIVRHGTPAGHEFSTTFAKNLPPISGDKSMVSQLILNLLTNAVEATSKPGNITVETGWRSLEPADFSDLYFTGELKPGDYVFVRVVDNGCGISPEVMPRIFDPFFTTKKTGSGLGLATVIGAVRQHAGCLALESEPGVGTSITAYLPVGEAGAGTVDMGVRVALVDDDTRVRAALEKTLTHLGYDVFAIGSGEEALEQIYELGQCDLLVLDQQMPGMSGMETFVALREQLRALPVVFISGYRLPPEISHQIHVDRKCSALLKPFSAKDFDETLKGLIGVE